MKPKVFVSYSWDDKEHEEWVMGLVVDLRRTGIDATFDKYITQDGNVHLDKMMVDGFKDSDKVILVLTENYASKADNNLGGVGFETLLSLPVLRADPDKLVLISRHHGRLSDVIPFHLKGYYVIDFSDDNAYFDNLSELTHKIRDVKLFELPEVGEPIDLLPRSIKGNLDKAIDGLIPNLTQYNDQDFIDFLIQSMRMLWNTLLDLAKRTSELNSTFTYDVELDQEKEKIMFFKINNVTKIGIHIMINDSFGSHRHITISYGTGFKQGSSNSFNEMISCSINSKNELELDGLTMSFTRNNSKNPSEMAKAIWASHIVMYLKH
ncbi:toll/interleukin-1 receptor domain-containing protein [Fusibacter bizertensis]